MKPKLLVCLALVLSGGLFGCSTTFPRPSDAVQAKATITELPSDDNLASALGVMMKTIAINYPSSVKVSVTRRVYRNGILDSAMSSRQVSGTAMAIGTEYYSLGWFNSDAINPEPQNKVKIFGSIDPMWIAVPHGTSMGAFIHVPKTGEIDSGKEQLVMELAYGDSSFTTSSGFGGASNNPKNLKALVRVTLHILVEPLSAEEQQELKEHPNFNKAFKVTE
jgi:hypothetical protein